MSVLVWQWKCEADQRFDEAVTPQSANPDSPTPIHELRNQSINTSDKHPTPHPHHRPWRHTHCSVSESTYSILSSARFAFPRLIACHGKDALLRNTQRQPANAIQGNQQSSAGGGPPGDDKNKKDKVCDAHVTRNGDSEGVAICRLTARH